MIKWLASSKLSPYSLTISVSQVQAEHSVPSVPEHVLDPQYDPINKINFTT